MLNCESHSIHPAPGALSARILEPRAVSTTENCIWPDRVAGGT